MAATAPLTPILVAAPVKTGEFMEELGIMDEEEEGIIMDEDDEAMGILPIPMPIPMPILPPFFILTYDTFAVNHLVFSLKTKKKKIKEGQKEERRNTPR